MKKSLLTKLRRAVTNTNNRFKEVEAEGKKRLKRASISVGKCAVRGGVIGGVGGYLLGWDPLHVGGVVALLDVFQNSLKTFSWYNLRENNPKKYSEFKQRYHEKGLVD